MASTKSRIWARSSTSPSPPLEEDRDLQRGLRECGLALPVYLNALESPWSRRDRKYPLAYIQGHSRFRTHSMFANVRRCWP